MKIGDRIKVLRTEQGLTLEAVGERVGVGKSTVRKWENGQIRNMRGDKIERLAKALNVTPGYLMGWECEEEKNATISTDNKEVFSENLQKYMPQQGMSRTDIAKTLKISYYTATDLVKGKKYPRIDKIERLAQYFVISKSTLIEANEKHNQPEQLNERTTALIRMFTLLDDAHQEMLLCVLRGLLAEQQGKADLQNE